MTSAKLWTMSADRLLGFVRRAFPKVTIYGGDAGGDASKMIRFMADEAEMGRVADALWQVDYAYDKATKQHIDAIRAAYEIRETAEKSILKTIL